LFLTAIALTVKLSHELVGWNGAVYFIILLLPLRISINVGSVFGVAPLFIE
jgi:hypothetical protein